jgi:hypothetical protein
MVQLETIKHLKSNKMIQSPFDCSYLNNPTLTNSKIQICEQNNSLSFCCVFTFQLRNLEQSYQRIVNCVAVAELVFRIHAEVDVRAMLQHFEQRGAIGVVAAF